MSKLARHKAILDVLRAASVASHDELARLLARRGFRVTQATLSRDMHELGISKTPDGYAPPAESEMDAHLLSLTRLVREFVLDIQQAQQITVVRTVVGAASPVAAAIDAERWPEVVGTVAGDDTFFIVSPNPRQATKLVARLKEVLA